jgi:phosphate transport system permease protein
MEEKAVIHASHNLQGALAEGALDAIHLEKSLRRPRSLFSYLMSALTTVLTLVALLPLFSVLYMLLLKGISGFSLAWFTQLPPGPMETGGGFGNAIVGTLIMVGLATLLSVPLGIVAAVYLAEFGQETRLASVVRFGAKVLSGFPSILAGVLAYGAVVVATGHFSALAGGVALAVLMLPTIILTAEDAIRMVPARIREAAIGMGTTRTQTVWLVLLPTAMPAILTGVMLAVARAAGETAPLIFTASFSDYWPISRGVPTVTEPTASLAVLIYRFSSQPYDNMIAMAWSSALVLVVLVLATNLIGQSLSRRND